MWRLPTINETERLAGGRSHGGLAPRLKLLGPNAAAAGIADGMRTSSGQKSVDGEHLDINRVEYDDTFVVQDAVTSSAGDRVREFFSCSGDSFGSDDNSSLNCAEQAKEDHVDGMALRLDDPAGGQDDPRRPGVLPAVP